MRPSGVATACLVVSVTGAVLLAPACKGVGPQTGSETNFLTSFLTSCDASCGDGLACICGVCTRACSVADECSGLASGAECVAAAERPTEAACAAAESAAFCDLSCSDDAACAPLGEPSGAPFRCQGGFCRAPGDGGTATACPVTTLAPGDNERTVAVGDATRSYVVRLPASYTGASSMPLVLDFHTLGGTSAAEAEASGYRELAESEGFIVAWPQGIDGAWNIGPCCTTSRDVDDVAFARALVQQVQAEACVDVKRVYAVGVANGGGMAYHLACNAADVFAGVAPGAFDLLAESEQPCQPVRPIAEISFRGTADVLVPYEGGAQQAPNGANITFLGAVGTFERWAELNRCTGTPSAADSNGCSTYSSCASGVEVTLCTAQGGGTAWGSPEIGWATLKRHSLP
ncbi:PHB depolymerase family esterase [Sorangium sp. So ce1014]|uniref:alpha/beta hydrolase family esterase n=1 Tax=Sorangium sp. So ce1014 TaxID=3133326 RepID=UPI003F5E2798